MFFSTQQQPHRLIPILLLAGIAVAASACQTSEKGREKWVSIVPDQSQILHWNAETESYADAEGAPVELGKILPPKEAARAEPRRSADPQQWADAVIARVNGRPILLSELREMAMDGGYSLASLETEGPTGRAFRETITRMVDHRLLVQKANLEDLQTDELEVARRVDAMMARLVEQVGGEANFNRELKRSQLDLESFRQALIDKESEKQLAAQMVAKRITVSSDEVREYKHAKAVAGEPSAEILLAQVLIRCPTDMQEGKYGNDRYMEALKIATDLGQDPSRFAKVARAKSEDDSSREMGGLLGWLDPNTLTPPIRERIASMRKGELSEPVTTEQGYHVLLLVDSHSPRDLLYSERYEAERADMLKRLRADAEIEIYDLGGPS